MQKITRIDSHMDIDSGPKRLRSHIQLLEFKATFQGLCGRPSQITTCFFPKPCLGGPQSSLARILPNCRNYTCCYPPPPALLLKNVYGLKDIQIHFASKGMCDAHSSSECSLWCKAFTPCYLCIYDETGGATQT